MPATAPPLAAVHYKRREDVSSVLTTAIARLRRGGVEIGGLLQEPETEGGAACRMLDLMDPRTGERARITQNRGRESRGCKLDEQGLLSMAYCIEATIRDQVDLVVINKFGRAEATGCGMLPCFGDVVCAGIPVLTAVRKPYLDHWREFHGGLAVELPSSVEAIVAWFCSIHRDPQLLEDGVHAELAE